MKFPKLLFIFLLALSCGKDRNYVPAVAVNFTAALNDPRIRELNTIGGAVAIQGYGVAGLIICRRSDNVFVAFDQCSTVNPEKRCAVKLDNSGFTATDPCSGGKFSLHDGAAVKAPASRPLRQYPVSVNDFTITVSN